MRAISGSGARVLLYSQDGLGLGHLRRTSSIAAALLRAADDTAVLTVLDSPLGPFFRLSPGQDCVKLPSIVKVSAGNWRPAGLAAPFAEVSQLRREMLLTVARGFRPDVLLVDHMPQGAAGELLPVLRALREQANPPRVVLGLRDIIDAPDVVRRVWTAERAFEALHDCYDDVLIYGRQDIFDSVQQYGFAPSVALRTTYAGYVCTPDEARYARRVRTRYVGGHRGQDRALLVATAGGGADGYPMMRAVLDALPILRTVQHWSAVLVTGPFMPADQRRDLERRARAQRVGVRMSVSDPLSYVHAADVVVGMAGYSSTVETLRSGTPLVLVPRVGPSAEQRMRSALFAERGWTGRVDPDDVNGERLAEAIYERLSYAGPTAPRPTGLDVVVSHLLETLSPTELDVAESDVAQLLPTV